MLNPRRIIFILIIALLITYPLTTHILLTRYQNLPELTTLWFALPVFLFLTIVLTQLLYRIPAIAKAGNQMLSMLLAFILLSVLTWASWPWLKLHPTEFVLMDHLGTNLLLAILFGYTLTPGQTPLISRFAKMVHGNLHERLVRYTRQATVAWAIFFSLMCLISVVLYFGVSLSAWSFFANVMNWPLLVLMFLGEFAVRRLLHSDLTNTSLKQTIQLVATNWRNTSETTHRQQATVGGNRHHTEC